MKTSIGRLWRTDEAGNILNDTSRGHIQPPIDAVAKDVIAAYLGNIANDVHSIYLTGSVPRGLGVPGVSDMDAFAVLEYTSDPELVKQDWLDAAEELIAATHECVSDVQLEIWAHGWLLRDDTEFSISAFIVKTNALCIWGSDLSTDLPDYNLRDQATRIAIANDDIVQVKTDIEEAIEEIEADDSPENVCYWCKRICKNILSAGFGLVMVEEAVHTRDFDLNAEYFVKHYPAQAADIRQALAYVHQPTGNQAEILAFLCSFGEWMIAECDQWLDQHNLARHLEYRFEENDN